MVLETSFPPDIRVEKEIRALKEAGHEVLLLCGHKEGQSFQDEYEHFPVIRFRPPQMGKLSRSLSILHHWATTRREEWEGAIERFVSENAIEALHVHDLPLVPTGLAVAQRLNISLVFDMHEVYPVMIRVRLPTAASFRYRLTSGIHSALFSAAWWDRVERRAVEQSDRIIVVIDESKDRLVRMGIPEQKIAVVMNAEDIDTLQQMPKLTTLAERYQNDFLVGYVGGIDSPNRGLENLVRAWPLVLKSIPNARLIIVGDGPLRPAVEKAVLELNLSEAVILTGRVPFPEVPAYIRAMDVAVIPHVIDEHTNHTIPHKLFQYIALGKPVVASDIVPIRRILEDTGAGIIVSDWSPRGFAEAIVRAQKRLRAGEHDPEKQQAVLRAKYGIEELRKPLLKLYETLEPPQFRAGNQ